MTTGWENDRLARVAVPPPRHSWAAVVRAGSARRIEPELGLTEGAAAGGSTGLPAGGGEVTAPLLTGGGEVLGEAVGDAAASDAAAHAAEGARAAAAAGEAGPRCWVDDDGLNAFPTSALSVEAWLSQLGSLTQLDLAQCGMRYLVITPVRLGRASSSTSHSARSTSTNPTPYPTLNPTRNSNPNP